MASRSAASALWIAAESTFGTDPDSDGSDYTAVPVIGTPIFATGGAAVLDTDYATGEPRASAPIAGVESAAVTFKVPLKGMISGAADGTAASAVGDDYLDLLLACAFGADTATTGDDVAGTPAAGTVQLTNDALTAQDVAPLDATGATILQWRHVGTLATTYPVNRNWDTTPATSDIMYGSKNYRGAGADGSSLSVVVENDGTYTTLLGGRVNSLKISATAGQIVTLDVGMIFDSRTPNDTAKSSLGILGVTTHSPIVWKLSQVAWNGTALTAVSSFELDFGLTAVECLSSEGTQGRADIEIVRDDPTVTIKPTHVTTFQTDRDAATQGVLEVQVGGTVTPGSTVATTAVTVASNVATATVAAGHGLEAGMLITSTGLTTDLATQVAITSVTSTTIVYPLTAGDGALADGVGTLNAEVVNSCFFYAPGANITDESNEDDGGKLRNSVSFRVTDTGVFTGTTLAHYWTLARA